MIYLQIDFDIKQNTFEIYHWAVLKYLLIGLVS